MAIGRLNHRGNESIPALRNCLDITGILGRIVQRPPQLIYRRVQTSFKIDKRPFAPEVVSQLLASHQISGMRQKSQQDLKGLPGQPYMDTSLPQFTG